MAKKTFKRLSKKEFNFLKRCLKNGFTMAALKAQTGRSHGVLGLVKKSGSFTSYQKRMKEANLKFAQPKQLSLMEGEVIIDQVAQLEEAFKKFIIEVSRILSNR